MNKSEARLFSLEKRNREQQSQIDVLLSHAPLMIDLTSDMQAGDNSITVLFDTTVLEGATLIAIHLYDSNNIVQTGIQITALETGGVYTGVKVDFFDTITETYKLLIQKLQ
jgi:3D (Asp-Asp-Asp) domain-containing protein